MNRSTSPVKTIPGRVALAILAGCMVGTLVACGSGSDGLGAEPGVEMSESAIDAEQATLSAEEAADRIGADEEKTPVFDDQAGTTGDEPDLDPVIKDGEPVDADAAAIESKATPVKQYATGFQSPVTVTTTSRRGNADQYVKGTDLAPLTTPLALWQTPSAQRGWILSIVGNNTPLAVTSYIENKLKTVTSRTGAQTQALSLNSKAKSPNTNVQAVNFQNAYMPVEPVLYQRMWIKFDTDTLSRAKSIGARDFWQMFWEIKAEPDYRIRLQLQYSDTVGLYWQVQGDVLQNARALWSRTLKTVPVKLASHSSASGWHKVEVWMNRPGGRFKAAIDGNILVDYTGNLMGASRENVNQLRFAKVYSNSPLTEVLVDDLEIWNTPPADAWRR